MSKEKKGMSLAEFAIMFSAITAMLMVIIFSHYFFAQNVHFVEKKQMRGTVHVMEYEEQLIESDGAPQGVKRVFTMNAGEVHDGSESIAFFAIHQYVDVYIDDNLVYSLKKSDACSLGKTAGTNWINVALDQAHEGKTIQVILTPVYKASVDMEVEFLQGPQIEIVLKQLRQDWPQIALTILAMFTGLIFFVIAFFNFRQKKTGDNLVSLGFFAIMLGMWKFTDIGLCFIMWPNKTILFFYISVGMLMFLPVPVMKAMKSFFDETLHRYLDWCCVISTAIALIQILLQLFGIMDIRETLVVTHIVIVLNALLGIGCFLYEKIRLKRAGKVGVGRILFGLCAGGAVVDLTIYYIRGTSFGLTFTLLVFLVYVVVVGFQLGFDYFRKQNELLEKEVELASSRIDLMVSQIQPHFLYNAITSIMAICMQSSEKAVAALADFADYLRGNLYSLQNEKMTSFAKELHHIESYMRLEKLRFPDKLNIEYDIEVKDFLIPTLAIQPLMENAVKHGVGQKEEGGTVKLTTRELGDHILIMVEDTGVGFDPEKKKKDERSHLGLENVKRRISMMSKGNIEIDSVIGEGTVVKIELPKEL